jgi:hypothetical protein
MLRFLGLVFSLALISCPSWSSERIQSPAFYPNGEKILFVFGNLTDDLQFAAVDIARDSISYLAKKKVASSDGFWDSPAVSTDGTKIVFVVSERNGVTQLAVLNTDGSGLTKITRGSARRSFPAYSLDGKKVVYAKGEASAGRPSFFDLFELNIDTGEERQLSNLQFYSLTKPMYIDDDTVLFSAESPSSYAVTKERPTFWADYRKAHSENTIFKADKRNVSLNDLVPLFRFGDMTAVRGLSRDGTAILFVARTNHLSQPKGGRPPGYGYDLFIRKNDTITRVSNFGTVHTGAISHDGSRVAFIGPRIKTKGYSNQTIWVANADGTNLLELTLKLSEQKK